MHLCALYSMYLLDGMFSIVYIWIVDVQVLIVFRQSVTFDNWFVCRAFLCACDTYVEKYLYRHLDTLQSSTESLVLADTVSDWNLK